MIFSPTYKGLNIERCEVCNHAKFIGDGCDHFYIKYTNRKCISCQEFIPTTKKSQAIYCSSRCRERAKEQRATCKYIPSREMRTCYVCRKQFLGNGKKPYCSPECNLWALTGDKKQAKTG